MEVYMIKCKVNNKVYIGSSIQDKFTRWDGSRSGFSHCNRARQGIISPLYDDMRLYGFDQFELITLEEIPNPEDYTQHDLQLLEDKYIKHYWDLLGGDMMYNAFRSAFSNPECPQLQTQRARDNQHATFLAKYGSAYGNLHSAEAKENRRRSKSGKFLIDDTIIYGRFEFHAKLKELGYNLSLDVASNLLRGYISRKNAIQYPELDPSNPDKIWNKMEENV